MKCRFCKNDLKREYTHSFGNIPMTSNSFTDDELKKQKIVEYELAIVVCDKCGLIQQFNSPDPEILYSKFRNDNIGELWDRKYSKLSNMILKNCSEKSTILEIGGGNLMLANEVIKKTNKSITVIEKNPELKNKSEKINLFQGFLEDFETNLKFDLVYSSHVFEHIEDIITHLKKIKSLLNENGKMIISFPNFEKWINDSMDNAFTQEHITYAFLKNMKDILASFGFEITEVEEFENHSLFLNSKLTNANIKKEISNTELFRENLETMKKFWNRFRKVRSYLDETIKNSQIFVFGANSGSQILLKNCLKEAKIICILDNSEMKNEKILYGFDYIVKQPDILKTIENPREKFCIIFTGVFVDEIKNQVKKLNKRIKIITKDDIFI